MFTKRVNRSIAKRVLLQVDIIMCVFGGCICPFEIEKNFCHRHRVGRKQVSLINFFYCQFMLISDNTNYATAHYSMTCRPSVFKVFLAA